ncbi:MAG: cell division protein FtsQ/DivIB [Candidatus Sumerlaeaceae bacterium]
MKSRTAGAAPVDRGDFPRPQPMVLKQRAGARLISRRGRVLRRRLLQFFYTVGIVLVLLAVGHASYDFFLRTPYFQLGKVEISGVSEPVRAEISELIKTALEGSKRNILRVNMSDLTALLQRHPRIRELDLKKVYPDTLVVQAAEREPGALLSAGNAIYLMDWDGHVMERLNNATIKDKDYPCISGIPADDVQVGEKIYNPHLYKALDLTHLVKEKNPELYSKLSEVQISSDAISHLESITAILLGGMEVRFGDNNPIEMLPAFEVWANTVREKGQDPYKMHYVDLRFKDRVFHMDRDTAVGLEAGVLEQVDVEPPPQSLPSEKPSNNRQSGTKAPDSLSKSRDDQPNTRSGKQNTGVEQYNVDSANSAVVR